MQEPSVNKRASNPQQIPVRHHFIPELYLRGWVGKDGELGVVQNFDGRIHRSRCAPKTTGFEYHLYSYTEDVPIEDRAKIETDFFSRLDNEGAKIVAKIINNEELERGERILFAQFLSSMKIRNPKSIKELKEEASETFIKELKGGQADYEACKDGNDPATLREWVEINRPGLIANIGVDEIPKVASFSGVLSHILQMSWVILDFKGASKPLLTSDRPIVRERGLHHPDCIVSLSLSPRHGFFAFKAGSRAHRSLMQSSLNRLAIYLNDNVVSQAEKYAYCFAASDAPDAFFQRKLRSALPSRA